MKIPFTLLLIAFVFHCSVYGQNYEPVGENKHNLYFTNDGVYADYFSPRGSYVRSDFDSISPDKTIYLPYVTARYEHEAEWGCQYLAHHNWLGYGISISRMPDLTTFLYEPVLYDNDNEQYQKDWPKEFRLYHNLPVGQSWNLDIFGDFKAKVVSIETIEWEGIPDTIKTISVTDKDDVYDWDIEYIRISKNHGLVSFPNLQFFPYEWINCERAGMENPKVGIHEPSAREMFHMEMGDEYTVENNYEHHNGSRNFFYKNVKCIQINSDLGNEVNRDVEIKLAKFDENLQKWIFSFQTENQVIKYDEQIPLGKSNEILSPFILPHPNALVLFDSLGRKSNIKLSNKNGDCFGQPYDHCNNYFSYEDAFDTYFDCSGGWTKYDYYLPKYIKNGDEEWGEDVNFDSLLTTSGIVRNNDLLLYPNPNRGIFSFENNYKTEFKSFKAINLLGQETYLIHKDLAGIIEIEMIPTPGIYFISGITSFGKTTGIGRIVIQ